MVLIISMKLFLMNLLLAGTRGVVELAKVIASGRPRLSTSPMEDAWRQARRAGDDRYQRTCCPRAQLTRWTKSIMDTLPGPIKN